MTASAARTALAEAMAKAQEVVALLNSRTEVEKAAQETCRLYSVSARGNAEVATAALNTYLNGPGTAPAPAPAPVPAPAPAPSTPGTTLPDGVTAAAPTTDKASYAPGETAAVSVKLTVTGKATTARVIMAVRSPVNAQGLRPYYTLLDQENVPLGVGVLTFNSTYKFPADALNGSWEFYVAYLLPDGSWFNSLNTAVNVAVAITPAPAPTNPFTLPTTEPIANEGGAFTLTEPQIVKFLSPTSGLGYQKLLGKGTFPCNNGYFGEPAFGEVKKCYIKQPSDLASLPSPVLNTNQIDGTAGGSTAGFVEGGTSTPTPTNSNLFDVIRVEGNSISQSAGNNPNAWPKQLGVLLGTDVVVTSYALSSTTLVQMKDNYGAGDHAGGNFVVGKRNLCILGPSATNDFTQNNASVASLQFNLKTFFDKAKATGYTVWDSTELPRKVEGDYTQEMEDKRVQLNAWKRANWATYCHKLIDFESVVTLAMLYDGIHPGDNPGAKVMAEFVYPMVRTTSAAPAPAPSATYYKPDVVIFEGDSITQAYGVELGGMAYRWKTLDGNNNAQIINIAREGSQCRDIDDDFDADGKDGIDTGPGAVFVPNKSNAVVLMIATNDLANDNTSVSSFSNHMKSLSAKTRARGAQFWLQTILRRADANWNASREAMRVQLNNWILAGGEGSLDGFVNNENIANNSTNFKDGIHPTPAGNDLIAANIDAAFKAKTVTGTAPAPSPAPSPSTSISILKTDGTVDMDKWAAMAAKLSTMEGIRYRYGDPSPNIAGRTMWFQPGNHPWPQEIVGNHSGEWQLGTFTVYTDGYFTGGDFASNSLIVNYVADNPSQRIGVTALQATSTDHGTFTQKPELPWVYYGGGLDAEETLYWKQSPQNKVVQNPVCSANAMGKPGWAVQPITCFQNGFMATAGFNTMKNKSSCQLPSGLVPSAIAITSSNEFALVTCWDVPNKRGVLAIVALCGLGHAATIQNQDSGEANGWWGEWNEAHPGLPNLGNLVFMKCVGVINLPGMVAPTEISATTHHSRFGYLDGSPGEPSFGNMKFNNSGGEDRRRRFIPGGDLNRAVVKQGECLIISKSEKKAIWVDLKPLFNFYNYYYFTDSRSRYDETRNIGLNAGQWPYTFAEQPSQMPTITKTMTFDDEPTSVFVAPYAKQESWRQAWITFKGGKCRVFNTGGVNDTGNAAAKVEVGSFDVGPNPTKVTWTKEKARSPSTQVGLVPEHTRHLQFCVRGEAAVKWFDMNSANNGATERRKFQDPRVIDPISIMDTDNHGGEHYVTCIMDFMGRAVHNVRWGDMIMWTYPEKTRLKMGANGTDPFEYCGKFDMPGYPFMGNTANVS